jgi:antitoxin component YwqK of YwqJK toxin-antitoxin module
MEAAASFIKEIKDGTLLSFLPKDILDMLPGFLLTRTYYSNGNGKIFRTHFWKSRMVKGVLRYYMEGESLSYHWNGDLRTKCFYKEGQVEDELRYWDPINKFERRCFYKNGRCVYTQSFKNGIAMTKRMYNYTRECRECPCKWYCKNGRMNADRTEHLVNDTNCVLI